MRKLFLTTFLFICLSYGNLFSQNESIIRFKHLDYNDGLIGRRTTAAIQDSDGFMWIATTDALNRYDGHSFQHFNQSNSELDYSELNNRGLFEDAEGYLWLQYFDKVEFIHHQTFEVLTFEERFGDAPFKSDAIQYIVSNENNVLLISLKNAERYLYRNNRIEHLPFLTKKGFKLQSDDILTYNRQKQALTSYDFNGNSKTIEVEPFPIYTSKEGIALIAKYDRIANAFNIFKCKNQNCELVTNFTLKSDNRDYPRWNFKYDSLNQYIVAYNSIETHRNIYILDFKTGKSYSSNLDASKVFLCIDQNDIIWIGHRDGVSLMEFKRTPFDYYPAENFGDFEKALKMLKIPQK